MAIQQAADIRAARRAHPGYLSFVISGARKLVDRSNEEMLEIVMNDLHAMIPASREAKVVKSLVLKEKHATMAPDLRSHRIASDGEDADPEFLSGRRLDPDRLPATIESAVISGGPPRPPSARAPLNSY